MIKYVSILALNLIIALMLCQAALASGDANISSAQIASYELPSNSAQAPIVLICGNLWDGTADEPLGPMEILVKDGKIAEMDKKVSRPDGAKVVNLTSQMVTPGFIDSHVHVTFLTENMMPMLTDSESLAFAHSFGVLRLLLMNGFTTVRDMGTLPQWSYVNVDLKKAIDQGLVVGPRMIVGPHIISSTGGHGDYMGFMSHELYDSLKFSIVADGPSEVQRAVREEIKGGADWVKCAASGGFSSPTSDPGRCTYTQEELNVLVKTAHDQGKPVSVHSYGDESTRRSVIAGADSIEHANMASQETLDMIEENGIYLVPTQYVFASSLQNLNNTTFWENKEPWLRQKDMMYAPSILECQKNLAKSNVKIVFGTDAGTFPFEESWREFPTMVKNGISHLRTLKAATSMAAEMLGRPDLGTLAVGKTADTIAMPGDPFQDINITGSVDFVMKGGVIYEQPNSS
jgi:imidazolonepropionase-like amidohydrolase